MRIAVIDLGTNTLLMTVAEIERNKEIKSLLELKETPRMGENVDKTQRISPVGARRVLKNLRNFKKQALKLQVERIILIGTAALREAQNARDIKNLIQIETGLKLEIISGNKEAEFTYLGATADFRERSKKFILLDIGGGSTEVITGTPHNILRLKSLNIGSLKMTERFLRNKEGLSKMLKFINGRFSPLKKNFDMRNSLLIGSGGTNTTMGALSLNLRKYEKDRVHGLVISIKKINFVLEKLKNMSLVQRKEFMKVDPQRADIIIAGTIILREFMKRFGFEDMVISDKSLRWGVLEQVRAGLYHKGA